MTTLLERVIARIEELNPLHGKKLRRNVSACDADYFAKADSFLAGYLRYLGGIGRDLEYGIACYLQMVAGMICEQVRFMESGAYTSSSFDEVNRTVYGNPEVMESHLQGLLLSQILWKHHYAMFSFFANALPDYKGTIRNYLEIGGGHGLYMSEAIRILGPGVSFDLVDVSQSALDVARQFIASMKVTYIMDDILTYKPAKRYDAITMGEVMEHVEQPVELLASVGNLLHDDGVVYITTPTNAPAIDHIYLFRTVQEIRDVIRAAAFEIVSEVKQCAEDVPEAEAERRKITVMYGAFLKKMRRGSA
jgi:2-polyprenyl-3-methyl-5-hydroxy-6-metoxy-1,4-benzoquinol methylase